jgi:hypothetical protein
MFAPITKVNEGESNTPRHSSTGSAILLGLKNYLRPCSWCDELLYHGGDTCICHVHDVGLCTACNAWINYACCLFWFLWFMFMLHNVILIWLYDWCCIKLDMIDDIAIQYYHQGHLYKSPHYWKLWSTVNPDDSDFGFQIITGFHAK